jgi:hypothetical protein
MIRDGIAYHNVVELLSGGVMDVVGAARQRMV